MSDQLPTAFIVALATMVATTTAAQSHDSHDDMLKRRGAAAMGFNQDAATHHFLLTSDGGAIQVTARQPRDTTTQEAIRSHLQHIAAAFAAGDFDAPLATHGEAPPGVAVMKRLKSAIAYRFEDVVNGGRVQITTQNAEALSAIHDFLRYQIREHKTGDPQRINSSVMKNSSRR
jgi:hypothetical protein